MIANVIIPKEQLKAIERAKAFWIKGLKEKHRKRISSLPMGVSITYRAIGIDSELTINLVGK